jgi:hypothetical protein
MFRSGAKRIKLALEGRLGARAPWVQPVVVVWGEFPQARYEEQGVVYLRGEELRHGWISWKPNAPRAQPGDRSARNTHSPFGG